jgi:hypothetical protein
MALHRSDGDILRAMSRMLPQPGRPEDVLRHIGPQADVILPLANGEPVGLIDTLEEHAETLEGVRVHQMHALHERPYILGAFGDRLRHVSYFLSAATREPFWDGCCDLVPNHFSEMPQLLQESLPRPLVLAAASPPDRHGYFSLGTNADYVASLIGRVPFFLEVNGQMPRTFGLNQLHASDVLGWCEADRPLVEVSPAQPDARDRAIAAAIVEQIPDHATLQIGIGGIPNAVLEALRDHHGLGIHTELLADGIVDLVERGAVTGTHKFLRRNKVEATFCLGTQHLYDWLHDNGAVELLPVDLVNDPRRIAKEIRLHLDQRDDRGRSLRAVRVGDDRRPLLVLERRPGGLRAGRDVLARRQGVHRSVLDDQQGPQPHPRAPDGGVGGHDAQEHGRPRGDRVGNRQAARQVTRRAGRGADRDRPSRPSRRARA